MKATDLRIGNWVKSKLHGGLETEVFSVFHHSVKLGANPLALYKQDEIEPIPLAEEWLFKLGFVKLDTNDIFYIHEDCMNFKLSKCLTMTAWHNLMLHDVKLEHVHQLQNLYYALTGEELTIK